MAQKVQKGPKFGRIENKKIGLYFQNQSWLSTLVVSKNVFNLTPTTKIASKKCMKGPKFGWIEKKIGLYFQNQSWLSILVVSKNVFEPDPDHKIASKGQKFYPRRNPKSVKEASNVAKLTTKKYSCTSKTKVDCLYR